MEVSVNSHVIRENQLRYKLKSDKLLYKATALDESANSSAEQPVNAVGSQSSDTTRSEESKKEARQMLHCSTKASLARRMEPLYLLPQLLLRTKVMKSQEKANYKPLILGQDELTRAAA